MPVLTLLPIPREPSIPEGVQLSACDEEGWKIRMSSDGTNTIAEVIDTEGGVVGIGYSRRRKGDKRDQTVGTVLAVSRAFADAANSYAIVAAELLG